MIIGVAELAIPILFYARFYLKARFAISDEFDYFCIDIRQIVLNVNLNLVIMPEICRFYGIIIRMFFRPREHDPAHIHAVYNEFVGIFDIRTYDMIEGDLPAKAQSLVREWLMLNHEELQKMWDTQIVSRLEPLE